MELTADVERVDEEGFEVEGSDEWGDGGSIRFRN